MSSRYCSARTPSKVAKRQSKIKNQKSPAFTLLELLVAMAVLGLMAVMMLSLTSSAQKIAKQTSSRTEQFREGRRAFERINQRLSQATLNSYWDYVDSSGSPRTAATATSFTPNKYFRISELRYLQTNAASLTAPRGGTMVGSSVFFQAPLGKADDGNLSGLNSLLNTVGFFIERGDDSKLRPETVSASKTRHRLYELTEPTENLTIYTKTSGNATYSGKEWYETPLDEPANSHRLADNIVALLFEAQYRNASGTPTTAFNYTSAPRGAATQPIEENNLPPNVRVTMIAVDETSGRRIADGNITLTDATDDASLALLEKDLTDNRLNYRKFESTVSIGPAKWSSK
ncbi:MAG: prepilin-type N-terminal cleavage/methylation domain-containing protein [Verrucomicrobia bacterium]|nr:prepilin-type N-terminal cleavage/methylation domain-containing protein [Verrucomicrobiota bacterium]